MGLDFCCNCGDWCGANEGTIRQGESSLEIICRECLVIEVGQAEPVSHDLRSGTLNTDQGHKAGVLAAMTEYSKSRKPKRQ